MIPLLKGHCYAAPLAFKLSKDSSTIPQDHVVSYGLTALFARWIKKQWAREMKAEHLSQFTSAEHAYLGHSKKYRCILPPSCTHYPQAKAAAQSVDKEVTIKPSCQGFIGRTPARV